MNSCLSKPIFSVVIPAYNAAPYVAKAIESVLSQRISMPFEIVVVDDGSLDATATVAASYGNNVRCLRKMNGGRGSARNAGVAAAQGDIVLLLDADDVALPGCPQAQVELMLAEKDVDVCFGVAIRQTSSDIDHLAESGLPSAEDGFVRVTNPLERLLASGDFVPTSGSCVRRATYLRVGSQSESRSIAEDYEFWCRIAATDGVFAYTSRPVTWYRQENHCNLMTTSYAYTGPVEAMHAILTRFGEKLGKTAHAQARQRFLVKVETLLRYEWTKGGYGVTRRLVSLSPLIPRMVAWKWRLLSIVPGIFPRSARGLLVLIRSLKAHMLPRAAGHTPSLVE
jgi:glycosyltransferase involved in cell wall biosynthesis